MGDRQILPWQMNSIFIIVNSPPEMLNYAVVCRDLPTIFLLLRLLNSSQNKQNTAVRGKLKPSIVVKT